MKSFDLPSYTALERALNQTALKLHPSEAHGLICGILCGKPSSPSVKSAWEEVITGGGEEAAKALAILHTLYEVSANQLKDFLFDFKMVLPVESEELAVRAEALTLWCQGMLTGLKLAQVPIEGREPDELKEAIDDLIEIAKMNYEDVVASEEDETAYTELVEYVRMAAIYIYQDLHADEAPVQASGTIKSKLLH